MKTLRTILFFAFCTAWSTLVSAQDFLPGVFPDRILLTVTEDPARAVAVTWRTAISIREGVIEWKEADDSPDMEKGIKRLMLEPEVTDMDSVRANYFSTVIDGLAPATTYVYRVGSGECWSEWFQFSTPRLDETTLLFLGDAQNDLKSRWSRAIRAAYAKVPHANLILHAGDLINRSGTDKEWGEWHHASGFIQSMVPVMPVNGNHEYGRDAQLDPHWRAGFNLPLNGPKGLEETAYFVDVNEVRLIALNSQMFLLDETHRKAQLRWLETLLAESKDKWKIVAFHHPTFSTAQGRDNLLIREQLKPLFEKYGVHLVLQGHDHTYGRGTATPDRTRPVYVVSVSGPKMYKMGEDLWMEKSATDTQLFQVITLAGEQLVYRSYTVTGKLFDEFTLKK